MLLAPITPGSIKGKVIYLNTLDLFAPSNSACISNLFPTNLYTSPIILTAYGIHGTMFIIITPNKLLASPSFINVICIPIATDTIGIIIGDSINSSNIFLPLNSYNAIAFDAGILITNSHKYNN